LEQVTQLPAPKKETQIVYPPLETGELATLTGPAGTEMVIVCGRRGEPLLQQLRQRLPNGTRSCQRLFFRTTRESAVI